LNRNSNDEEWVKLNSLAMMWGEWCLTQISTDEEWGKLNADWQLGGVDGV